MTLRRAWPAWVCLSAALGLLPAAHGHDPHDVIDAVSVLGAADADQSLLYVIRGYDDLMRSSDGGASWTTLANGITAVHRLTDVAGMERPEAPPLVFLATDGDGLFRSPDGGDTWERNNRPDSRLSMVSVVAGCPSRPTVLAAGTLGGLFVSSDGGGDWRQVLDENFQVSALLEAPATEPRDGSSGAGALPPGRSCDTLAVGLRDSRLGIAEAGFGSWTFHDLPEGSGAVTAIVADPQGPGLLLGTAQAGVLRWSVTGDDAFAPMNDGLRDLQVTDLATVIVDANGAQVVASTWHDGPHVSLNGGRWRPFNAGVSKSTQADSGVFLSPHFREIALQTRGNTPERLYLAGFDGLFVAEHLDRRWRQLETEAAGRILDVAVSPPVAGGYDVAVGTYGAGVYLRTAGSEGWQIANVGLSRPRVGSPTFSPRYAEDGWLFALADEGNELLRLSRQQLRWQSTELHRAWPVELKLKVLSKLRSWGLPAAVTTDWLSRRERVLAHPKAIALAEDRLYVGTRFRGLFQSMDSGASVQRVPDAPPEIWGLAVVNTEPGPAMLATAREQGVRRSMDGGESWRTAEQGLTFLDDWRRPHDDGGRHGFELGRSKFFDLGLLPVARLVYLFGGAGLFVSSDGGATWQETGVPTLGDDAWVLAAAASPEFAADGTLIVSIKGRGLWISRDRGVSFGPFAQDLIRRQHDVHALAFAPDYPADPTLFAASRADLLVSRDGGVTWTVQARPVRYESGADALVAEGSWTRQADAALSSGSALLATGSARLRLEFVGTGFRVVGRCPSSPTVLVDGGSLGPAGQPSGDSGVCAQIDDLRYGPHRLEVRVGAGALVDAVDVLGHRSAQ